MTETEAPDWESLRARMVEEIGLHARAVAAASGRERLAPRVMEAMGRVPRHEARAKVSAPTNRI